MERSKLIAARASRHWTLEQASERIQVDPNTLHKWEKGRSSPRAYNTQRLCEVYGMTVEDLGLDRESCETRHVAPHPGLTTIFDADLTVRLMAVIVIPHRNYQVKQNEITQIIEEDTTVNPDSFTRREALRRVVTLPLLTLGLNPSLPTVQLKRPAEEIINQCAAGITACWELSKGNDESDLHLAYRGVSTYLPALKAVVRDSAQHRKDAASLAGQCALLKTALGWNLEGLRVAATYAHDAIAYAKEAGDIALQITGLDFQAWIYYYSNQNKQAEHTTVQAMLLAKQYASQLSPLFRSRIYGTRTLIQAKNKSDTGLLGRAGDLFFAASNGTPTPFYLDYDQASLIQADGMARYHQDDHSKAMASFQQMIDPESLSTKLPMSGRTRIETLNLMTMTSLKQPNKDMEQTLYYWKAAIQGAITLQSDQRFNEALTAYEIMEALWPNEKRIKDLYEHIVRW